MRTFTKDELAEILRKHKLWLVNKEGGERADLRYSNLSYSNLSGSDLRYSDLRGSDLRYSNLLGSDLRYSNLLGLSKLTGLQASRLLTCPETGAFDAWKKCRGGVIVKLRIPAKAKRSSATGRKCRAEYAKVLAVYGADHGVSEHDGKTEYRKGETVQCDNWSDDRWQECAGGIHFFITRAEAEAY